MRTRVNIKTASAVARRRSIDEFERSGRIIERRVGPKMTTVLPAFVATAGSAGAALVTNGGRTVVIFMPTQRSKR
jgi:hypothetical protein